jgi:hypothetical protein
LLGEHDLSSFKFVAPLSHDLQRSLSEKALLLQLHSQPPLDDL